MNDGPMPRSMRSVSQCHLERIKPYSSPIQGMFLQHSFVPTHLIPADINTKAGRTNVRNSIDVLAIITKNLPVGSIVMRMRECLFVTFTLWSDWLHLYRWFDAPTYDGGRVSIYNADLDQITDQNNSQMSCQKYRVLSIGQLGFIRCLTYVYMPWTVINYLGMKANPYK